jgi:hypothetical protein
MVQQRERRFQADVERLSHDVVVSSVMNEMKVFLDGDLYSFS